MELLLSNIPPAVFSKNRNSRKIWEENISKADHIRIATGFISSDSLIELNRIIEKNKNPRIDMLIGMHYFNGFSKEQYRAAMLLNETLQSQKRGAVMLSLYSMFHGKLYSFSSQERCYGAIIGSSNLGSLIGGYSNLYEVDYYFTNNEASVINQRIIDISGRLGKNIAEVPETNIKFTSHNTLLEDHYGVERIPHEKITEIWSTKTDLVFELPVKTEKKSNLNAYFGKGRVNTKTGFEIPRPWYEVELIVPKKITDLIYYPRKRDFKVYTDDGWSFQCETNGQNSKNFRSQKDLKILGKWIKGKLENNGGLEIGQPVTKEVLEKFGNNIVKLIQTTNPHIWLLEFKSKAI